MATKKEVAENKKQLAEQNKLVKDLAISYNKTQITSDVLNAKADSPKEMIDLYKSSYLSLRKIAEKAISTLATMVDKDQIVMEGKICGLEAVKNRLSIDSLSASPRQIEDLVRITRDKSSSRVSVTIRCMQQNLFK